MKTERTTHTYSIHSTCSWGRRARSKLTYPNSRYVTYASDALHRLDTVTDDDSTVLTDYDYKGGYLQDRKLNADALRLTFKNSTDLDGYDAFGRIGWMRQYDVSGPTDVVKLGYARNYVGAPNYQEDLVTTSLSELYTYDTLHRLTNFKRGTLNGNKDGITGTVAREQSWTLQHVGNWTDVTSTVNGGTADTPYDGREHDTVNQITHITPQGGSRFAVTSDSAGNLSVLPDRTDLTKADRYTYDFRNRLIKAEHSANYDQQTPTWTTTVDYLVDGLNRRVKKDLPGAGVDVIFVYDGWRCIEERENGQAVRQFVFGGLYLDEVLLFDKDTDADGDCTDAGGSSRYLYATNDNYNVVAVTDGSGTLVERIQYDPYGQPTCTRTSDNDVTAASHFGNPFLFQGQRYCPETGLYYFKNRDYYPTLGRFLQRDPIGYKDGKSLYFRKAVNVSRDPLGLQTAEQEYGSSLGGAMGSQLAYGGYVPPSRIDDAIRRVAESDPRVQNGDLNYDEIRDAALMRYYQLKHPVESEFAQCVLDCMGLSTIASQFGQHQVGKALAKGCEEIAGKTFSQFGNAGTALQLAYCWKICWGR